MVRIFDNAQDEFGTLSMNQYSGKLRFSGNGKLGFSTDQLIYLKNDDNTKYYTNVTLTPMSSNYDDIVGEWGETGFGVKLLIGERRPTENEWDQITPGEAISIPDIGTTDSANTSDYTPVWVRVIVPGSTKSQLKTNIKLRVNSQEKNLGT